MNAPFTYPGSKRSIAHVIWAALGELKSYHEPFFGSGAVLLAAPRPALVEVVNDKSAHLVNVWRAIKHQPEAVARNCVWLRSSIDANARYRAIYSQETTQRLKANLEDPRWQGDAEIAGWWIWGVSCTIGRAWSSGTGNSVSVAFADRGTKVMRPVPTQESNRGVYQWISGDDRIAMIATWLRQISTRLESVYVLCGDWKSSVNTHYGLNDGGIYGAFIDPPYRGYDGLYGEDVDLDAVVSWCIETGARDRSRIVLAGHEGDYDLPGWRVVKWSRSEGGQGPSYAGSMATADKEALFLSPGCLEPTRDRQISLL